MAVITAATTEHKKNTGVMVPKEANLKECCCSLVITLLIKTKVLTEEQVLLTTASATTTHPWLTCIVLKVEKCPHHVSWLLQQCHQALRCECGHLSASQFPFVRNE